MKIFRMMIYMSVLIIVMAFIHTAMIPVIVIDIDKDIEYGSDILKLIDRKENVEYEYRFFDLDDKEITEPELNKEYRLVITAKDKRFKTESSLEKIIKFIDTTPPEITADDVIEVTYGDEINVIYEVSDNYKDEEIEVNISEEDKPVKTGSFEYVIEAKDKSDNVSVKKILIRITDKTPPLISIRKNPYVIYEGSRIDFNKAVDVKDDADEDIDISFIGDYDTKKPGDYVIKVIAIDDSDNISEDEFVLKVIKKENITVNNTVNEDNGYVKKAREMIDSGYYIRNNGYACEDVAAAFLGYDSTTSLIYAKGYFVDYPSLGDIIIHFNSDNIYSHMSVYIGDNKAFHGNYSNGNPMIASMYCYSYNYYIHPGSGDLCVGELIASKGNAGWLSQVFN